MNLIGDSERLLAELWPFRVPIASGFLIVLVIVGFVVWRQGWYRIALDRPRASIAVVVLILVIALPIGWYAASPLFIRTELQEEAPVAAVTDGSVDAPLGVLLEGEFTGADDFHFGSGQAQIIETAPGELTLHLADFSVLNGPDLFVYLSPDPDGWTPDAVNLGALKATDGSFSYEVPDGLDAADIGSAIIWCRAFSVLFASAPLAPADAA
jgi:hypothetical protein